MSYRILDLRGLCVDRLDSDAEILRLHFTDASIEKIMDNAEQRTLWRQSGYLEIEQPTCDSSLPKAPFTLAHADLRDAVYTQRDMIRIPMEINGGVTLQMMLEGQVPACVVEGAVARLHLEGDARYVRHLDAEVSGANK